MPSMGKKPISVAMGEDGVLEVIGIDPDESPAEQAERKRVSVRCGHIKRRLVNNERLTGELLAFAVSIIEQARAGSSVAMLDGMADKLTAGKPLSEYEFHIMVDVLLLHKRLGAGGKLS